MVICAVVLSACGSDAPVSGGDLVGIEQSPSSIDPESKYRPRNTTDAHGALVAESFAEQSDGLDVYCRLDPEPGTGLSFAWLDTVDSAEAVVAFSNSSGQSCVIVVTYDASQQSSKLVLFSDSNADGLPDQSTRSVIATELATKICFGVIDKSSSTFFAIDASNRVVHRYFDTNADGVPDSRGPTPFFDMSSLGQDEFLPCRLADPVQFGVTVLGPPRRASTHPLRAVLVDTNTDGVAELPTVVDPNSGTVELIGLLFSGDTNAIVHAGVTGSFELRIEGTNELLASFGAVQGALELSLSRALQDGDVVQLYDSNDSVVLQSSAVFDSAEPSISWVKDNYRAFVPSGTLVLEGRQLAGTEIVEVAGSNSDSLTVSWQSCTVVTSSSTSLSVTLPCSQ